MAKNFKHLTILFAFAMQTVCLTPLGATDVILSSKEQPKENQTPEPSRAPGQRILALSVSLDEENRLLTFSDSSGNVYTYYIYDEAGNIVTQGILDFSADDTLLVNLSYVESGTYTLNVVHNGQNYVGTFSI